MLLSTHIEMPHYLINICFTSSKAVEIPLTRAYKRKMFLILSHLTVSKCTICLVPRRLLMVASISRSLKMEGV